MARRRSACIEGELV
ncbi:hypothetical protein YPPY61_0379, partial [Yersinia pestis PY-61]